VYASLVVVKIGLACIEPGAKKSLPAPQGGEMRSRTRSASDAASNEGPERRRRRRRMRLCLRIRGMCHSVAALARPECCSARAGLGLTIPLAVGCPCANRCSSLAAMQQARCLASSPTRLPRRATPLRAVRTALPPRPPLQPGLLAHSWGFESACAPRSPATLRKTFLGSVCRIPVGGAHSCTLPRC
jgi:hypothetical protein